MKTYTSVKQKVKQALSPLDLFIGDSLSIDFGLSEKEVQAALHIYKRDNK